MSVFSVKINTLNDAVSKYDNIIAEIDEQAKQFDILLREIDDSWDGLASIAFLRRMRSERVKLLYMRNYVSALRKYSKDTAEKMDAIDKMLRKILEMLSSFWSSNSSSNHGGGGTQIPADSNNTHQPGNLDVSLIAQPTNSDCGPTSAYMVIKYLDPNTSLTINDVKNQYASGGYILGALKNIINNSTNASYAYKNNPSKDTFLETLQASLNSNQPCIALGKSSNSTEPLGYKTNGHYVVVSGIFQDQNGNWMAEITDPFSKNWSQSNPQGQIKNISVDALYGFCQERPDGGWLIHGQANA